MDKTQLKSGPRNGRRNFIRNMSIGTAGMALGTLLRPLPSSALFGSDKSEVSFLAGKDRREMIYRSLLPFREDVEKAIGDRQVIIKVNAGLAIPRYEYYSTHPDQLRGILDFLKHIHERPVIITEGTATAKCSVLVGFENYGYMPLKNEYNVKFVDANDQPHSRQWIRAAKHHPQPVNIIDLFMDPDVYLISAARMKTHNCVVGTFSLKNVGMGSPVCHFRKKGAAQINEKSYMHGGRDNSGGRELSWNLFHLACLGVRPDLAVIDGVEAIEGDGPWDGEIVEHGVVISSPDFVAADRMCSELMGIDPKLMKYIEWCADAGMGNFDLSKIKVNGPDYKDYIITYKMNKNIDWQIAWIKENFEE